ncbi:alpha-amylase family glycosyl hydrolase [Sutcliffiella rhizosphaerae]|uniref:Alpha-amylase n=1 Tax=Sutcliffiella rhizosphaerae TaxID=2880967 RepID=A0ABM8YU01_9BACI|nr:alpha-amylase family glycosyl hydrolase [Sutcliffiella rhizosphaerae]CAG9623437.1 Beta/alpha-amylase [Sutcliffiella rhizosphaerae]
MKRVLVLILVPFLLFSAWFVPSVQPVKAEKEEHAWQDEIIYFIMIDRFNNGDISNDYEVNRDDPKAYHGGDFRGIIQKLDYIKDMGFTALWLTPIFQNEEKGYHGYWTEDFYNVEEHFGTLDEFKELVKEAHSKDIKVIVDLVVNHTGYQHPWLKEEDKADWFNPEQNIRDWNNQEQVENGWIYGLPDLNQNNPEVRNYLIEMAKWWIEETNIDGYRLDTVKHVPKDFWEEFASEVKSVKGDFFLIGEVWDDNPEYVASYQETGIDSLVDFPMYNELTRIFSAADQPLSRLDTIFYHNQNFYDNPYVLGTFLDNHDVERFTRAAINKNQYPPTRLKLALTYMYSAPGIPIIYYGTEIALDGGEDPDNRRNMNFRADKDLIEYITKLAELRKSMPSLTRGTYEMVYDNGAMAVIKRQYEEETTFIAINNSSETKVAQLDEDLVGESMELRGTLADELVRNVDGNYTIGLDRESAEIYTVKEDSGVNVSFVSAMVLIYGGFVAFIVAAIIRRKKMSKNKE